MRLIVAGSRVITDAARIFAELDDLPFRPIEVVSGGAPGPDSIGAWWAETRGVGVKVFQADWDKLGKAAGPMRNRDMVEYVGGPGGLIAFWYKRSPGTGDIIRRAKDKGLWLKVVEIGYVDTRRPSLRRGIISTKTEIH